MNKSTSIKLYGTSSRGLTAGSSHLLIFLDPAVKPRDDGAEKIDLFNNALAGKRWPWADEGGIFINGFKYINAIILILNLNDTLKL